MRIWMAASENGALRGGKVGGIGDVLRDLPLALAEKGHEVAVFTPAYGAFHRIRGGERVGSIRLEFAGRRRVAALYRLPVKSSVTHYVIEHSLMTVGHAGRIYHDDGPDNPFATDASRFAFFSAAMAAWVEQSPAPPDVLHLHDWHTSLVLFLRRFADGLKRLKRTRCVFTIHNLAYQGIRPLAGHRSSLEAWFPDIPCRKKAVADSRYPDCINLMAIAVRLADKVNTVSAGYMKEILEPSDPERGFIGGEGLERDLREAESSGRLIGILNGCTYPGPAGRRPGWSRLLGAIAGERHLFRNQAEARQALGCLPGRRPSSVLISIGRVTDQKSALFLQEVERGRTALEAILAQTPRDFVFIMLGSGDSAMEAQFEAISQQFGHFLFLRGYSESLPDQLYAAGDLFLMPSSFEPCGISQMLAMRAGQPCVVHAVGGLRDTVVGGKTGFRFRGRTPLAQARQFVRTVAGALEVKRADPERWRAICQSAAAERFTWEASAENYLVKLYAN